MARITKTTAKKTTKTAAKKTAAKKKTTARKIATGFDAAMARARTDLAKPVGQSVSKRVGIVAGLLGIGAAAYAYVPR